MTCMRDSETHKQVRSCCEERREAGSRRDMGCVCYMKTLSLIPGILEAILEFSEKQLKC